MLVTEEITRANPAPTMLNPVTSTRVTKPRMFSDWPLPARLAAIAVLIVSPVIGFTAGDVLFAQTAVDDPTVEDVPEVSIPVSVVPSSRPLRVGSEPQVAVTSPPDGPGGLVVPVAGEEAPDTTQATVEPTTGPTQTDSPSTTAEPEVTEPPATEPTTAPTTDQLYCNGEPYDPDGGPCIPTSAPRPLP